MHHAHGMLVTGTCGAVRVPELQHVPMDLQIIYIASHGMPVPCKTTQVDQLGIAGGEEYVYQSCMTCGRMGGWMEGSFTFIEGSLQMPLGPQFEAQVLHSYPLPFQARRQYRKDLPMSWVVAYCLLALPKLNSIILSCICTCPNNLGCCL